MRLQQHLITEGRQRSLEEVLVQLYTKCKPCVQDFVKQGIFENWDSMWMWTGRKDDVRGFMEKQVRENRRPRNTPADVHEAFDDAFAMEFGFRARSQAVFCTGDMGQATYYGRGYALFPNGDYDFVYSPDVRDLYMKFVSTEDNRVAVDSFKYWAEDKITTDIPYIEQNEKELEKMYKEYKGEYSYEQFSTRKYLDAMEKTYNKNAKKLRKEWEDRIQGLVKEFYKDDSLKKAINSKHEIMVGCDKYTLIESRYLVGVKKWFERGYIKPTPQKIMSWAYGTYGDNTWGYPLLKGDNPIIL